MGKQVAQGVLQEAAVLDVLEFIPRMSHHLQLPAGMGPEGGLLAGYMALMVQALTQCIWLIRQARSTMSCRRRQSSLPGLSTCTR